MRFKFDMSILHQLLELTVSSRKIEPENESGFYALGLLFLVLKWMRDY